jgi:GNAT superfamily N-acetyltransferase
VGRRIASLSLDTLEDLPEPCRGCVFWELDQVAADRAGRAGDTAFEKEAWLSSTLLQWGSCGKLVYVDDVAAGYAIYAPPAYVPRSTSFPTSPVGADAVLLAALHVVPEFRGGGLGRILVQQVAKDLIRRNVRAVEAFGHRLGPGTGCVLPAGYLRAIGFKTVRSHPRWPRLRLDVKNAVTWRADVEVALEKLIGSVTADLRSPRRLTPANP